MSIVKFEFSKEKDLKNIWETCNSKKSYGLDFKKKGVTKNILKICESKSYSSSKKELSKTMSSLHKNILMELISKNLNSAWKKIEKEYFDRLEKITGEKFPLKKIRGDFTSAGRCPYNPSPKNPSFFVNLFGGLPDQLQTAGHELMHLHLHNTSWWKNVEREIGWQKTSDLKEAMTVLLNIEFRDLWFVGDRGYPNHVKLRKYIVVEWKKKKDFNLLTEKCIKWIKRNGIK